MRKNIYFFLVNAILGSMFFGINASDIDPDLELYSPQIITRKFTQPKKHTTFLVYMAANNDLYPFAIHNLRQMMQVGSNNNINIVVELSRPGRNSPTQRIYIEKNSALLLSPLPHETPQKYDSGNAQTLINFVQWAVQDFPAEHYALILWDHATGVLDPGPFRSIKTNDLYFVNPESEKLEIDRGIGFMSVLMQELTNKNKRAVCFDDTFHTYISNPEIMFALKEITTNILKKPLDLIGFDACLMGMIEIASLAKNFVNFMVASEELEYGNGWNYAKVLKPFESKQLSPKEFCQQIVHAYGEEYEPIANDYTQSGLDLSLSQALEENISQVAILLTRLFTEHSPKNLKNLLKLCKSPQYCTCMDEPSYIDLGHFYKNLLKYLPHTQLNSKVEEGKAALQKVYELLHTGLDILHNFVIHNVSGEGMKNAHGVSICFPEYRIHQSYLQSNFSTNNNWSCFINHYINA
jgi:hypothetical protein